MKIATWNVNGIRARHEQFAAFVKSETEWWSKAVKNAGIEPE